MPTPEWFAENPKISAYVSKEIDDALKAWMQKNRVKKVSQALTQILNEYLELVEAPKVIAEGQYATLEQLREVVARVEALEKDGSPKKTKSKPKPKGHSQLTIESAQPSDGEWLSAKDAHTLYGADRTYDYFRKASVETFKDEFGLEADPNRKEGKKPWRWLRKV